MEFPSQELKEFKAFIEALGVPHRITATTGGDHAAHSYHYAEGTGGKGRGIDVAGPKPGSKTLEMTKVFNAILPYAKNFKEFFYNGGPTVYHFPGHDNHIHIGLPLGWKNPIPTKPVGVKVARRVTWDVADALDCPTGGTWLLFRDGGIGSVGGAPSKPENIPAGKDYWAKRLGARLDLNPECKIGYIVTAETGETYKYCF